MRLMLILFAVCLVTPAWALEPPATEDQKTLYAIGQTVARQLEVFRLTPEEFQYVLLGLTDTQAGKKPNVDLAPYGKKIQELARSRRAAQGQKMATANREALEHAAQEPGAVKSASGLVYRSLKEGAGTQPTAADSVRVQYRGTLVDGREFDSSYKRGHPLEFKLNSVIKCWSEGVQRMKTGGRAKLACPASLAYGEQGAGELILPGATLLFEIELLEVKK